LREGKGGGGRCYVKWRGPVEKKGKKYLKLDYLSETWSRRKGQRKFLLWQGKEGEMRKKSFA